MRSFYLTTTLIFLLANGLTQSNSYINGLIMNKEYKIIENKNKNRITCSSNLLFNTDQLFPVGLASDGSNIWISGYPNRVPNVTESWTFIHDFDGNIVDTFFVNGISLAFADLYLQADTLWAVVEQDAELYKLNKYSGEIYDIIQLPTISPEDPNNWGITFDGSFLWNCEYSLDNHSILYKIDPYSGIALDNLIVNLPSLLAIEFINGKMYGIDRAFSTISSIDLVTGETEYVSEWCLSFSYGVSYEAETGSLYGISGSVDYSGTQSVNKLTEFDFATNTFSIGKNIEFSINPNPANEYFSVSSPFLLSGELRIFDFSGKLLISETISSDKKQIQIKNLPNGIYFVQIIDKNTISTHQFIIQR